MAKEEKHTTKWICDVCGATETVDNYGKPRNWHEVQMQVMVSRPYNSVSDYKTVFEGVTCPGCCGDVVLNPIRAEKPFRRIWIRLFGKGDGE